MLVECLTSTAYNKQTAKRSKYSELLDLLTECSTIINKRKNPTPVVDKLVSINQPLQIDIPLASLSLDRLCIKTLYSTAIPVCLYSP